MNKISLYSLALGAVLCAGVAFVEPNGRKGRGEGQKGGGHGRGYGKAGKFGKKEGFGRRQGMGEGLGYFMVDKKNLRKEIKDVWEKFEELRKFKKSLREERLSKFKGKQWKRGEGKNIEKGTKFGKEQKENFKKIRKENAEKVNAKLKDLGLSLSVCSKLRELSELKLEERIAINIMENQIIRVQLKLQGKGLEIEKEMSNEPSKPDLGNIPLKEWGEESEPLDEPEF